MNQLEHVAEILSSEIKNSQNEGDLFSKLSPEVIMEILSRLPFRMIIACKCVSKSWLTVIESNELVNSPAKSPPCLAVYEGDGNGVGQISKTLPYKVYEFVDEHDPEYSKRYCKKLFQFSFPHIELLIHGSVNGLLFLSDNIRQKTFICNPVTYNLFICNPVTRDYIKLPSPLVGLSYCDMFGFGVSRATGQYKVVRLFNRVLGNDQLECQYCQVYTLGTGSWRSIALVTALKAYPDLKGVSMNGNFHCLAYDVKYYASIFCFDLETEVLSTFSAPCPLVLFRYASSGISLSNLRDCLSLCQGNSKYSDRIVIWLMKSYGDCNSWTRQFIISTDCCPSRVVVDCPIKAFKDGDVLITTKHSRQLLWFSNMKKEMGDSEIVKYQGFDSGNSAVSYTPSFLSLKTFPRETVVSSFGRGGSGQRPRRSLKRKKSE